MLDVDLSVVNADVVEVVEVLVVEVANLRILVKARTCDFYCQN